MKEKDDEIDWNDIEMESFETESVATKFTEDETNYPIESTSNLLTPCILLDMIDKNIKCCNKFISTQRPLAQLIGTWEVDEQIFLSAKKRKQIAHIGSLFISFYF